VPRQDTNPIAHRLMEKFGSPDAVVAAGAVVVSDVAPNTVVAGCPAKVIKVKDEQTASKTALIDALRTL